MPQVESSNIQLHQYIDAANSGDTAAQLTLAKLYEEGVEVKRNMMEALGWLTAAAEAGSGTAQFLLAKRLYSGDEIPQDVAAAIHWYELAALQGNADAQNDLGLIYFNGDHVIRNTSIALELFQKAAATGQPDALNNLGAIYSTGDLVAQNHHQARFYFEQAASKGNVKAQLSLGLMYAEGLGVEEDCYKSEEWLLKAATAGDEGAQMHLGILYSKNPFDRNTLTDAIQWLTTAANNGNKIAEELLAASQIEGDEIDSTSSPNSFQPTPMVQEQPNGDLHLDIVVVQYDWKANIEVKFGGLGCKTKSFIIEDKEHSSVEEIIRAGLREINAFEQTEKTSRGKEPQTIMHTVTIDWRTQSAPQETFSADFRLTYSSATSNERGFEYSGSLNDYYFRDDPNGARKVKEAKLQIIRSSSLDESEKHNLISIIDADFNKQLWHVEFR